MELLVANKELILTSIALLLSALCVVWFLSVLRKMAPLNATLEGVSAELEVLKSARNRHAELLNELRMVTQGMSQKLTSLASATPSDMATKSELMELKAQLHSLEAKLHDLENQDSTSRLYTKASKLVASGASVEEIMQECDLPRAEAELVMSLHAKK